ncbi:MAG: sodium:solute symporter family protein [Planctomycetota bacterium]
MRFLGLTFLGLHEADVLVVAAYVAAIMGIGWHLSKRQHDTADFYLGGRRLGKFYQFFLNFGITTDAGQASTISREIYRQGIGGMWIQYLVIWLTPFYWFTSMLLRRVRLTTVGDFFADRLDSRFLGAVYAVFMLFMGVIGSASGYLVAAKMMQAVTVIPDAELSPDQRQIVAAYQEYQELSKRRDAGLSPREEARYQELDNRAKSKKLKAFFSYVDPLVFYLLYGLIVGAYTMLGGFTAAAVTDSLQGILIVVFSLLMIPFALTEVGGFSGLHAKVPDYKFHLFGSAATSEYTWPMVAAMTLANLVSIIAVSHGMSMCGSARTETAARFGAIAGTLFKRVIMIAWALIGLLAVALYSGGLHDPDLTWGYMTKQLLAFTPGLIGLMLVGILAANMSTLDASSVAYSALFIKNIYQPLRPGRSERHYISVGRLAIGAVLAGGIVAAYFGDDLMVLFKYFIALPGIFGAVLWLGFVWRRLTRWAVLVETTACITLFAIVPNVLPLVPRIARAERFLATTEARETTLRTGALAEDVAAGRAARVGELIEKRKVIDPIPIYFSTIVTEKAHASSADPGGAGREVRVGCGRFNAEVWLLALAGVDFRKATGADLETARFLVNALLPFLLLITISLVTPRVAPSILDRFFAKMHTPVRPDPEEDRCALEASARNREAIERLKLFPGSNWEFGKPSWVDAAGFFGCWAIVGCIIFLLWLVVTVQ